MPSALLYRKKPPITIIQNLYFPIMPKSMTEVYLICIHLTSEKEKVYNTMPGLIQHFELVIHGIKPPKGEVYAAVEGPRGELGYYVVSDGTEKPYRLRIRPPSFINISILPELIKGHYLADIIPIIGSLDPLMGEVDR